jgi:phosphatidylglycerol---prolipoprotein diacylglyceryl transferase
MSIVGPYIHHIDPIIGTIFGIHLWWYGLGYSLGFLNAHLFMKRRQKELGLSIQSVYTLSLLLSGGVLLGGRFVEVIFYEWRYYSEHLSLIAAYWLGGMSTHGILFGGLAGVWIFSRFHGKTFLSITDVLVIPAAVIMGLGRIGNFIDGQIVGSVTTAWWAVKFPDAEGFRHPVVLYDGLKNLLIVPVLVYAGKQRPAEGFQTGIFLFLYAFLRLFIDIFREYPTTLLGLATGQVLNISLSIIGLGLILISFWKSRNRAISIHQAAFNPQENPLPESIGWQRILFAGFLVFSLVIPSDWTQDIPIRYGLRHEGLEYSSIYPRINTISEPASPRTDSQDAAN